ncbi:MAG TPA: type II toxin-antitoxin system PrlF family antitoxin [Terracidiphilus sp.]|nr:type II toxin-antitoxin system PrlF family antitoxin [Terracidiphilus sp.]
MATATKRKAKPRGENTGGAVYRGKLTRTGNSSGFRFEGALFKSHPEFQGEVRAHVIAPGRMLVTAEPQSREKEDPVLSAFLAFLAQDMERNPESIRPLDEARVKRIERLTKGVVVDLDEDLGEESLL